MKRRLLIALALAVTLGIVLWPERPPAPPTVLSFHVGQPFEEVAKNSTFSVMENANIPSGDNHSGAIWVTEPSVIIRFNDPQHGFTLPPTKFASVFFMDNRAETLSTTPMLDKLPFDEAVAVLANLQKQFKAGGWEPWRTNGHEWFDFSLEGRKQLHEEMFAPGWSRTEILRVPNKYSMTFRFKCAAGCNTREPPYLFLIDIGLAHDFYADHARTHPEN